MCRYAAVSSKPFKFKRWELEKFRGVVRPLYNLKSVNP